MATSKDQIIRDIKNYVEELNRHGINVQKTYLFGSWVRGGVREDSDIDVALISESFSGDRFYDRRKIVPFRRKININIEPMPFNRETFFTDGNLAEEIRRHGEEIN
jgi:predicted nucleotidyltransferase